MLVFSAIVPHSPLLIPSIGKEHTKKLKKTIAALEDLEGKLYVAKPDVILIISPHGEGFENTTTLLLDTKYTVNFKEFGDFRAGTTFQPFPPFIERLRRSLRQGGVGVAVHTENPLNHGVAVPITYLATHRADIKMVPLLSSHTPELKHHFDIGKILKDEISHETQRIAVIASADLSHTLTSDAPAGFSKNAKAFDDDVRGLLENKNSAGILKIDPALMREVEACGMRPIATLLGIIDRINTTTQIFSYEAPFGVGYMVANFKLL